MLRYGPDQPEAGCDGDQRAQPSGPDDCCRLLPEHCREETSPQQAWPSRAAEVTVPEPTHVLEDDELVAVKGGPEGAGRTMRAASATTRGRSQERAGGYATSAPEPGTVSRDVESWESKGWSGTGSSTGTPFLAQGRQQGRVNSSPSTPGVCVTQRPDAGGRKPGTHGRSVCFLDPSRNGSGQVGFGLEIGLGCEDDCQRLPTD